MKTYKFKIYSNHGNRELQKAIDSHIQEIESMYRPQLINNGLSSQIHCSLNLALLRLRLALALWRMVGGGTPD